MRMCQQVSESMQKAELTAAFELATCRIPFFLSQIYILQAVKYSGDDYTRHGQNAEKKKKSIHSIEFLPFENFFPRKRNVDRTQPNNQVKTDVENCHRVLSCDSTLAQSKFFTLVV